jgi:transposase
VDLARRQVAGLLADRSAETMASWLKDHPEVEAVSRDGAGLYAEAARQGAPQARQIADRFHLAQNFRDIVALDAPRTPGGSARTVRCDPGAF